MDEERLKNGGTILTKYYFDCEGAKMKTHYYFGWFNETMPKEVGELLNQDLTSKKSLVMISTVPAEFEYNDNFSKWVKESWFDYATVIFEEHHLIDYRVTKEDAEALLKDASAILLHGGHPGSLKNFIEEYNLDTAIKISNATVIMGASAGGMNLSAKFAQKREEVYEIQDGMSLDEFAFMPHVAYNTEELRQDVGIQAMMPVSESIPVYACCEESTLRVKDGNIEIFGDVYLITDSEIKKLNSEVFE